MKNVLTHVGAQLIKGKERCVLKAYPDCRSPLGLAIQSLHLRVWNYESIPGWRQLDGKPWTCGWGHTRGVIPGVDWTQEYADFVFEADCAEYSGQVRRALDQLEIEVNDNQFSALISFTFNLGIENLLKLLRSKDLKIIAGRFVEFDHDRHGEIVDGLLARREAERNLFLESMK